MKTITKPTTSIAMALGVFALSISSINAAVLITNFNNTGVSGNDMNGVTWTEDGLSAPTTLSATVAVRTGETGDADAEGGYFSGDVNVNGSAEVTPAWSMTFTVTVGGSDVSLTDIVLTSAVANSGALLGAGNGSSNINLSIVDNTSTATIVDETLIRSDGSGTSQALTYTTLNTLTAGNTYEVTFKVWEASSSGHYEAFDSLTFNGTVTAVPEPTTTALLGLGGLALILRRRK